MKNCMIDIETMGVHTSNSLILSFAALCFDMEDTAPLICKSELKLSLTTEPQLLKGRQIDPATQRWWSQQSPEAASHWMSGDKIYPGYAHEKIADYLRTEGCGPDTLIWANGIVFDLGNLESLFSQYSETPPWKYNVTRDARTVYNVMEKRRDTPQDVMDELKTSHDPLVDCKKQIWRLWEHWVFK